MQAQMMAMKDKVIASKVSKMTTHGKSAKGSNWDAKGAEKQSKPKPEWTARSSQDDLQDEVDLSPDNLESAFGTMLNACSQESNKS